MTNQEKKDYLSRYRIAGLEARRLEEDIQRWEAKATAITPRYSSEPGGGSGDKIQGAVDKIMELQVKLAEKLEEQIALRREVEGAIDSIQDQRMRQLMKRHYIDGLTWGGVAEKMYYSRSSVIKLQKKALDRIKITPNSTSTHDTI